MPHYSVEIVANEIHDDEPLKSVTNSDELGITSFGYSTPMTFNSYITKYSKHKIDRRDLIFFRDDLSNEYIFDFVSEIMRVSKKNLDTWWGILAIKCSEKDEESWKKIGCNYYGNAVDVDSLTTFLRTLKMKQANYERYTKSKRAVG